MSSRRVCFLSYPGAEHVVNSTVTHNLPAAQRYSAGTVLRYAWGEAPDFTRPARLDGWMVGMSRMRHKCHS